MMADPFRLRVMKALTAALKEITPANGYVHDLSDFVDADGITKSRVYRGRVWFGDDDPLPMVCILEPPYPQEASRSASSNVKRTGEWEIAIQGFLPDDPENPTDPAYGLVADVMKALVLEKDRRRSPLIRTPDILGLGGFNGEINSVTELQVEPGFVRPADEISAKAYFWLNIKLVVAEDVSKPFD